MSEHHHLQLPSYLTFEESSALLKLPFSPSELHGMLCGYLCADAGNEAENYLRVLSQNDKSEAAKEARIALFHLFSATQEQLHQMDFSFHFLLPDDEEPLRERAQALSEWCEGFTQTLSLLAIDGAALEDEETADSIEHINAFATLDYESLSVGEEDEKAFMEIHEYARMTVLRLYHELHSQKEKNQNTQH